MQTLPRLFIFAFVSLLIGLLPMSCSSLTSKMPIPSVTPDWEETSWVSEEPIQPIPTNLTFDGAKVALGRSLFADTQLSRNKQSSCTTCHIRKYGGGQNIPRSLGKDNQAMSWNSPTIYNVLFNFRQLWNGRAATLTEQLDRVITGEVMAMTWPEVVDRLKQDPEYKAQFRAIYGRQPLQATMVQDALVTYEESLVTPNAKFDRYLQGEQDAITERERHGYDLFKGYGCIACHNGVNMGGNMFQKLGVVTPYVNPNTQDAEADLGRYALTQRERDRGVFKVPSLRNVALTAPYLHDGHVETLAEVVKLMGEYQLGRVIPQNDIEQIVDFLETLTGELPQE